MDPKQHKMTSTCLRLKNGLLEKLNLSKSRLLGLVRQRKVYLQALCKTMPFAKHHCPFTYVHDLIGSCHFHPVEILNVKPEREVSRSPKFKGEHHK